MYFLHFISLDLLNLIVVKFWIFSSINDLFWLVISAGLFRSDSTSVVGGMPHFFSEFGLDFLFFCHPSVPRLVLL